MNLSASNDITMIFQGTVEERNSNFPHFKTLLFLTCLHRNTLKIYSLLFNFIKSTVYYKNYEESPSWIENYGEFTCDDWPATNISPWTNHERIPQHRNLCGLYDLHWFFFRLKFFNQLLQFQKNSTWKIAILTGIAWRNQRELWEAVISFLHYRDLTCFNYIVWQTSPERNNYLTCISPVNQGPRSPINVNVETPWVIRLIKTR